MNLKKYKKQIIISISVIFLAVLIFFGINLYIKIKQPFANGIGAIPENCAFIFEIKKPIKSWQQMHPDNKIWIELEKIHQFSELVKACYFLDSISKQNETLNEILSNKKLYISGHFTGADQFDFLFISELKQNLKESLLIKTIGENHISTKRKYQGVNVFEIKIENNKLPLLISIHKGVLIAGFYPLLVEASIGKLNTKEKLQTDGSFNEVSSVLSEDVNALFYINYQYFYRIISKFAIGADKNNLFALSEIAGWSKFDISIKPDVISLNGYTSAPDTANYMLNIFKGQSPQNVSVTKILPHSTSFLLFKGFSDAELYFSSYTKWLNKTGKDYDFDKELEKFAVKSGLDISKHLLSWIKNEYALVITDEGSVDLKENSYLIMKAFDKKEAEQLLESFSIKASEIYQSKLDTSSFREFRIGHLGFGSVYSYLLGPMYQSIQNNYYIAVEDFIVFGNSKESLQLFINSYLLEKTMMQTESYQKFINYIPQEANLYMYINPSRSSSLMQRYINPDFLKGFWENNGIISNFESFGITFLSGNDLFYTNMVVMLSDRSNDTEKSEGWEIALDANISGYPNPIIDHRSNTHKFLVFDISNNAYLIDTNGKIEWKISIPEKPIGKITVVDILNNGKNQFLFNSQNYIYLLDINGNMVDKYPIKLENKAINNMLVLDYANTKDYRLLFASPDKRIYNYSIEGKPIKGWEPPSLSSYISSAVQFISHGGKDFIISADTAGEVIFCNRKGEIRITAKLAFTKAINSDIFAGEVLGKPKLITTDRTGRIVLISPEGEVEKIIVNEFSSSHYFLYADIDNDGAKDYIFFENKNLWIYGADFKQKTRIVLPQTVDSKPEFIPESPWGQAFGYISNTSKQIVLVNFSGVISTPNLRAESPFITSFSKATNQINITCGYGKILYNYRFR